VQAPQIAVENGDVVGVDVEFDGRVETVVGDVDRDSLVVQPLGDVVGEAPDVFDDEDSHAGAA
jgi:hypothetical protein